MSEYTLDKNMLEQLEKSLIVVDTSVLLVSDPAMLNNFPQSYFVVPHIVINELEEKRVHPTLGYAARQWLRWLENLRVKYGEQLSEGVPLEDTNIVVLVEPNHTNQDILPTYLKNGSNDSTILAICENFKSDLSALDNIEKIVLLSNDTPMRLHATLDLNINAIEYNATVASGSKPFSGFEKIKVSSQEYADFVSGGGDAIAANKMLAANLNLDNSSNNVAARSCSQVLVGDEESSGGFFLRTRQTFRELPLKQRLGSIGMRNIEQDIALSYLRENPQDLPIVSISGGAGTGKTLVTIAAALDAVKKQQYQRVLVFRSLHEMGVGQEMGYLPGDVDEKMAPWSGAVRDALDVIAGKASSNGKRDSKLIEELSKSIEVSPITYLRGRSLSNSFIILDEAQNFSRSELLNIISRVGENTKIVLLSDSNQVDNKFLQSGDKSDVWSVVDSLKHEVLFAHVTLFRTERSRVAELASKLLESTQK